MNSDSNNIEEQNQVETENDVEEENISELENYNQEQNIENPKQTKNNIDKVGEDKNMDEDEEPIYVMTLALEQGRSEKIEIFANSDPKELAYNFCRKNNLDFSALDYLREQITKLLEAYEKQDGTVGEGEGEEEEINENDAENSIEEENNNDDKEGDLNIPEIEEVQETLEMNSNENIKEVNTDNNINNNSNNNEEEYKINSLEKNNEDNDIDNNDNNMKMDESNDKSIDNNEIIGDNDNFEKEGDCNNEDNEDNEDNDSDEIVKEIDFRNIPQRQNDIILNKNDKTNQNIQSLPEFDNINNDIKEKDINEIINENIKEINKDESNKKEKDCEKSKMDENKKEENENLIHNKEHNNEDKLNDIDFQSENIKNDLIESGEKDKNENNNDYEQENINDNFLENSNKKESDYQEKESCIENNEKDNNSERKESINKIKENNNYFIEQMEINNKDLEVNKNKNNNVLLNEQEENDIRVNQKDGQFNIGTNNKNFKNKTTLSKTVNKNKKIEATKYPSNPKKNDFIKNKFSIEQTSSTPIIINSNSEIYNNNNNIFSKNDFIEGNIIPNNNKFKTTTEYDRVYSEYAPSNQINKNVLCLNEKINSNSKRNSYSYINENNKNMKKIGKKEILNQNYGGRNSQSHKQNLFEKNKKYKQEKEKEILSIQKQVDKIDSKKSLLKENIDINNLYDMNKYSNFNNMESSNHFRKEQSNNHIYTPSNYYNIGKVNRLMEEYNKKYSFHPIINDNYKTDLTFDERLNIFNNISKAKKEELKNNLLNIKVDENGQEYFKPKLISRQYYTNYSKRNNNSVKYEDENEKKMDIFNKNYLYWKKYNSNKEKLYNKYYNNINEPHFFSKVQSTKYLNEANYKAFCNLFNELDSDQDNLITSLSMNLNNIPDNILKIIEPLLVELKEDQQTLNQDEFIKAMSKLYENISSTERRQLISEYNNTRQKNTNKDILPKNSNKNKKNCSLIKKETDNNLNFNNISNINNSRMSKKSYLYFDDNNFDNNFLSSRPKTPIYNMGHKNNRYNFNFVNQNNKKEKENNKINMNNNTNILAYKHYLKVRKMMKDCNNFNIKNNKDLYNIKFDDSCFDDKLCYRNQKNYASYCMTPKSIVLDENKKFSLLNDYTYNNYLKNLN